MTGSCTLDTSTVGLPKEDLKMTPFEIPMWMDQFSNYHWAVAERGNSVCVFVRIVWLMSFPVCILLMKLNILLNFP